MMLCRCEEVNRTYYRLRDILSENYESLKDLVNILLTDINTLTPSSFTYTNEVNEFINYLVFKHYNSYLMYTDSDDEYDDCKSELLQKIATFIYETEKRYGLLIKTYKDNESKLMDKLLTSTSTRFNDTPQDSGDYSDNEHTSNISKTDTQSDVMTTAAKLNEIKNKWYNLYSDWLTNFSKKFVIYM